MLGQKRKNPGRTSAGLSVTALYTSAAWSAAQLPHAEIFFTKEAQDIYTIVNGALAVNRFFGGEKSSLPRSLLFRHKAIDDIVARSGSVNILELASGLSSRGLRLSENAAVSYVEVDLAHVISFKKTVTDEAVASGIIEPRPNLRFVARDILTENLDELVDAGGGTLALIAEGFVMYLNDDERRLFFQKCASMLAPLPGGLFLFDFVPPAEKPKPRWIGRLLGTVMRCFTAGRTFEPINKSRHEIREELIAAGFHRVEFVEPNAAQRTQEGIEQLLFLCHLHGPF